MSQREPPESPEPAGQYEPDERPERPSYDPFPLWEVAVAVGVVLIVVAVAVFLLFQRTNGPGEVLNDFYEAAATGDCEAAYELLTPQSQERFPTQELCTVFEAANLTPDFEVLSLTLTGDPGTSATVEIQGGSEGEPDAHTLWTFALVDDSWLIDGACESGDPGLAALVEASGGLEGCVAAARPGASPPSPAA